MINSFEKLPVDKKLYFASDFHLGVPSGSESRKREAKIIQWLEEIRKDAGAVFLLGDIFDFWFEYKHTIPKGFIRLQGKLAEFTDNGIPVIFFTGNHDMWMFDYFPTELNIPVYREPQSFRVNNIKFMIGHGDGLGPGDRTYKLLKKIFNNKICQWLFGWLHPNVGMAIANRWSRKSRINSLKRDDQKFHGDDEWILAYTREVEKKEHHDFYIFGHRHLPLDMEVNGHSRYINLGEWVNHFTYGVFDGQSFQLLAYDRDS